MKQCVYCSEQNEEDHNFCKHCGAPLGGKMICPVCGASAHATAVFCPECGVRLRGAKAESSSPPWLFLAACAGAVLVVLGLFLPFVETQRWLPKGAYDHREPCLLVYANYINFAPIRATMVGGASILCVASMFFKVFPLSVGLSLMAVGITVVDLVVATRAAIIITAGGNYTANVAIGAVTVLIGGILLLVASSRSLLLRSRQASAKKAARKASINTVQPHDQEKNKGLTEK